ISTDTNARLTRILRKLVARRDIHHAKIAITSGEGKFHWSAAAGPVGDTPEPDTPFFIASITKRFIMALVLQAHERGELHLSTPIHQYLPAATTTGLHVFRDIDRTSEITV